MAVGKKILKSLGAAGALAGAGGGGYLYGRKKGQERLKDFSGRAIKGLRGQQRLINALARRNQALGRAYVAQQRQLAKVLGKAKKEKGK